MPSHPRIDKGEGLIRTHDLLQELRADIDAAYEILETDRQSQYLRRCVVRAVFSYIEALIECIKVELRSALRRGHSSKPLSAKERETLGSLTLVGGRANGKFLSLEENIRRTFKLAAKIWDLDFQLDTQNDEFNDFIRAKSARNRLTHPKTFYDIQITDLDLHYHSSTRMWLQQEFGRLFQARIELLMKDLSDGDRNAMQQLINSKYS